MIATRSTVTTVFGGSGFIGRYVVKRLAAAGHIVRVAVRDPEGALFLKPMGAVGQVVPFYAPVTQEADERVRDGKDAGQRPDEPALRSFHAGSVARLLDRSRDAGRPHRVVL